jgi:hypothetical protein
MLFLSGRAILKKDNNQTVAEIARMEHNENTDDLYLVFKVVDEGFKKRIKKDWMEDIELKIIGKKLVIKE